MNKRRQYRATADFEKLVQLQLLGPKVHAHNVRLLDLSSGGAGVELPASASGMLLMRDLVELRVLSPRLPETIDMRGKVAWLDEAAARPKVGIVFVNWREHRMLLDSQLKGLFNEREAFRVEPDHRHPITAEIHLDDGATTLQVKLRDISVLGLALRIPAKSMDQLPAKTGALVTLRSGHAEMDLKLRAEVRHVREDESGPWAHAGFRLVHDPRGAARAERAINRFVMQRQRDSLRLGLRPTVIAD
jgi:c-di-GMP-binding flagellar brake protein YcgR